MLRCTVVIALLIALGNMAGSIWGFTPSGHVTGPAVPVAAVWSLLWALAAIFPVITAHAFERWWITAPVLAVANAATVACTGGIDSPVLAVCMYVGWIASVVVAPRAVVLISLMITGSLCVGYFLASNSVPDILSTPYRYAAVTNAVLPIVTGMVGLLLAGVTNTIFSRLPERIDGLRSGAEATTPAMTALLRGEPVLQLTLPAGPPPARAGLTSSEREVVALLADGHRPKQIAQLRGVAISTVRSQIKAAKRKTGSRTIEELIVVAWQVAP